MNSYEQTQCHEIRKWKEQKPNVVSEVAGGILKPIVSISNLIIPHKAIEGALNAANILAELITDEKDILRDSDVNNISELKTKDLELSDKLANEVHNWAIAGLGAEGGAAGFLGLPGMVVDIPAVVTIALRTIHKIGLCYGYRAQTKDDQLFVYTIMSIAGSNTMQEKSASLIVLKRMNVILAKNTWWKIAKNAAAKKASEEGLIMTIKQLASKLGITLTKRKALQIIPMFGAGVGAAMNVAFINDISWAARRCFQERWLQDNGKI